MQLNTLLPEPAIEVLHGVQVTDPFRWLEDRGSRETTAWIAGQKQHHDAYFAGIADYDALRSRVSSHLNVEVLEQPVKFDGQIFYRRRRKDQEQACICVRDMTSGEERILVDPSPLGQFASVAIHRISADGSLLAYELKQGGPDCKEIHVVTSSGELRPDRLPAGYARGFAFASDLTGFYYCHDDTSATEEHTIRFHPFGADSNDPILFRSPRTSRSRLLLAADDVHLGAIRLYEGEGGLRTELFLAQYDRNPEWTPVFTDKLTPHWPLLYGGRVFVLTEDRAPNKRIVELARNGSEIRVVVPESDFPIQQVTRAEDRFFVLYLEERKSVIRAWNLDGTFAGNVAFPNGGTLELLPSLNSRPKSLFCSHESFTEPLHIHEHRPATGEIVRFTETVPTLRAKAYRIEEVWYQSIDGTKIPMLLVMRRDLDSSAPHPAILTSYGGFGVSMTPKFSVLVTILLELGAVFAMPSIRGGGEFGQAWHEAARGRNHQVAIDDFVAAAEWISRWRVTSPRTLGVFGGSHSGLLVAAAMTQRPTLFRAVLCIAPLLDMVRHELFDRASKWRSEFGSVDDAEDFAALYSYSPYHQIRENVNYPATLFVTGDRDDRCNPAHVRKMAAHLQNRVAQRDPILVDYSSERGHSPVLPLSVRIEALTRRIAFFCKELGLTVPTGGLQ